MEREPERRTLLDWPAQAGHAEAVLALVAARGRRRRQRWSAAGAALVLGVILAGALNWRGARHPAAGAAPSILLVQAPEARVLPDGSRVEIKSGARIASDFAGIERRVTLERGTVHFTVQKNPRRPFIVTAGDVAVRAVGTAFSVSRGPAGVTVVVTEGRVAVTSLSGAGTLGAVSAGEGVVVASTAGMHPIPRADLADQLQWRIPRLELSATPVREIVATLNRLNSVQIELADPKLGELRLSGAIRADNVDAFVGAMQAEYAVKAERLAGTVRLSGAPH